MNQGASEKNATGEWLRKTGRTSRGKTDGRAAGLVAHDGGPVSLATLNVRAHCISVAFSVFMYFWNLNVFVRCVSVFYCFGYLYCFFDVKRASKNEPSCILGADIGCVLLLGICLLRGVLPPVLYFCIDCVR